mgnify:CR=1 FL=1|tara:strand:- start:3941 stop:4711 length:771 start_codon:yes stop_codon:yes gene_type:complete
MQTLKRWGRNLGTYGVVIVFGIPGGLIFSLFWILGLIHIEGYGKLAAELKKGGNILALNHPTLVETVVMPVSQWFRALYNPKKFFLWSLPDKALFPKYLNWLYGVAHCIKIDRETKKNGKARRLTTNVLETGGNIVAHPEEGRTDSPYRGKRTPRKPFGRRGHRKIRRIVGGLPEIAHATGATIIPIYVDIPFMDKANGFKDVLKVWILERHQIRIYVGDPYKITGEQPTRQTRGLWLHNQNKRLGRAILEAGLRH